ncbi:5-formyltetrahydrofolate cyclo-ligase [Marinobacterium stanieri]|uniref:5-formyltetrahydrofolate cyclo-ligase n=1 Tax=Marinobacterium stanieri TaxID=49186 RepID=UPI003A954BF1
MMQDRKALRREIRQQRRALSRSQQRLAGRQLAQQLSRQIWFRRARHIALYLPNDGEIDTRPIIALCRRQRQHLYLPVLHPVRHNRLWFTPYTRTTPMRLNRYRISEPVPTGQPRRPAFALDLVLMPLVAFSPGGGRLGMGGGYYDRTFAFKLAEKRLRGPRLVGLAHELQRRDALPLEPWDVPLNAVVTDNACYEISY